MISDLYLVKDGAAGSTNYTKNDTNGIESILNNAITIATEDKIVGFGLN